MTDEKIQVRSEEDYASAAKIIRVLVDRGLVTGESEQETFANVWEAAFEILDIKNSEVQ